MTHLFSPLSLRNLTFRNRIALSPMCMYSADKDGFATDWHRVHYATRAIGGAGLLILEATAVESRGRISDADLGLWNDDQVRPLVDLARLCQDQGAAVGIQLAHAGRKAWSQERGIGPEEPVAPSALPHDESWAEPRALTPDEIDDVVHAFSEAARRADEASLDVIEIHAAHGYLLHQFLSPLANRREDDYGGSLENRARLVLRVVEAAREAWPEEKPLFVRISATDWDKEGLTLNDQIQVARWLGERGVDVVDCSSGGIASPEPALVGPGYHVPFAEAIRREAGVRTQAVGLITSATQADQIVRNGEADLVALGRELLRHPYWPLSAARRLKQDITWPEQYRRAKGTTR